MATLFGDLESERHRIREEAVRGWGVSGIVDFRNGEGVDMITKKFNPDQLRDAHGRWVRTGAEDKFEDEVKPGDVIQPNGEDQHYVVASRTPGYKFKNPAHRQGMREFIAHPVNPDGSIDPKAGKVYLYHDRYTKVKKVGEFQPPQPTEDEARVTRAPRIPDEPGMSPVYAQQLHTQQIRSLTAAQRAKYTKAREAGRSHGEAMARAVGRK